MMNKVQFCIIVSFAFGLISCQETLTSEQIVLNSIRFHDPQDEWNTTKAQFEFSETRPNGSNRSSWFRFNNQNGNMRVERLSDSLRYGYAKIQGQCILYLNDNSNLSVEEKEKHNLNCERANTLINYYHYLWGLPMKLQDEGTIIHADFETDSFNGEDLYKVKVTYDPKVGEDTWYFYFDTGSFEMKGYQFYHNETENDGEYIILSNNFNHQNLNLPNNRRWYLNKDSTFLGEDILTKSTAIERIK